MTTGSDTWIVTKSGWGRSKRTIAAGSTPATETLTPPDTALLEAVGLADSLAAVAFFSLQRHCVKPTSPGCGARSGCSMLRWRAAVGQ